MPSFTSSSERLPIWRGGLVLGAALAIFLCFALALEWGLARRGFEPGVYDDEASWLRARARAEHAGPRGLLLLGSSRMQLDADLDVLGSLTKMKVVQLAIDGSSFLPVFEGLAADPAINGTVVVDFSEHLLASSPDRKSMSLDYQRDYDAQRGQWPDFHALETRLDEIRNTWLRSYADGARPLSSLMLRALDPEATPQYLVTRTDRSRAADYSLVKMPDFSFRRARGDMGIGESELASMTIAEQEAFLWRRVEAMTPVDNRVFLMRLQKLVADAHRIEARGGKVFFINMPISGMLRGIRDKKFPRENFWWHLEQAFPGRTLHALDDPVMSRLDCPDGSHLDRRDREVFTRALAQALARSGVLRH